MNAPLTPGAVRRRFCLLSFFVNLPTGLYTVPLVLLLSARGLDPAEIGLVFAAYGVTAVVLELPTGGLADVIGRRAVLLMSAAIGTASLLMMGLGTSLGALVIASALRGVSRTLRTGPLESWYVDSLRAADPEADLKPGLAGGNAWASAALAAGALAGGLIPPALPSLRWGPVVPLSVPLLLAAAASAALFLLVLLAMPEPPFTHAGLRAVLRSVPATIGSGAHVSARDAVVLRVLAVALGTGLALNAMELLTPGRIAEAVEQLELAGGAYGIVVTLGFAATAGGSALAPAAARRLGSASAGAVAGTLVVAAALAGLAATATLAGAAGVAATAAGYWCLYTGLGLIEPLRMDLLHNRVSSAERATVLSIDSLVQQLGNVGGAVLFGWLATAYGIRPAWFVAAALVLAAALLYPRARAGVPLR